MYHTQLQQFYNRLAGYVTVESLHETYDADFSPEIVNTIISSDPTYLGGDQVGSYTPWIIKQIQSGLQLEDLGILGDYLTVFNRIKPKLEVKDIYQYSDFNQLYETVLPYLDTQSQSEEAQSAKDQADILYDNGTWLLVRPNTYEADCYYGKGTRWCTTSKTGPHIFDSYNSRAYLYIIINRETNNKFQFDAASRSFLDETDREGIGKFLELHPPKELLDWINFTDPTFFDNYISTIKNEEVIFPVERTMPKNEEHAVYTNILINVLNDYLKSNNLDMEIKGNPRNSYNSVGEVISDDLLLNRLLYNTILHQPSFKPETSLDEIYSRAETIFESFIILSNKIIGGLLNLGFSDIIESEGIPLIYNPNTGRSLPINSIVPTSFQLENIKNLSGEEIDSLLLHEVESWEESLKRQQRQERRDLNKHKKHEDLRNIIQDNLKQYDLNSINEKISELQNSHQRLTRFDWSTVLIPKLYMMLPDTVTPRVLRNMQREYLEFGQLLEQVSQVLNISRFTTLMNILSELGLFRAHSQYTYSKL